MNNLVDLLKARIKGVPIENWGYFYPCHLAAWDFIESKWPGKLGPVKSGFDSEPWFQGPKSDWFEDLISNNVEYVELVEKILTKVADNLKKDVLDRGFLMNEESLSLDVASISNLEHVIEQAVKAGVKSGKL